MISDLMISDWRCHQTETARWFTCDLLADWPHAFGTRSGGHAELGGTAPVRPPDLALALNLSGQAHWAAQVHGNRWVEADPEQTGSPVAERVEADAILTDRAGDSVWVCTADCVPIIVAVEQGSQAGVAAIHAGWRGTAARILPQVLDHWLSEGIWPDSMRVVLGPAISGAAYQVGADVAHKVLSTLMPEQRQDPELIGPDLEPGRVRLDLRRANVLQALGLGIPLAQISVCPLCTFGDPDLFFSYRRDQDRRKSDVQWSGIGIGP